jgi:hypothetical protein
MAALGDVDPETAFERGSVGQCIYMLLFEDPDCQELARRTAIATVTNDPMVASGQRPYTCTSSAKAARPSGLGSVPSARNSLTCRMRNTSP